MTQGLQLQFDPATITTFSIGVPRFDEAAMKVHLHYAFDDTYTFDETVDFSGLPQIRHDAQRVACHELLKLLALVAGTSYYKAAAPEQIHVGFPISQAALEFGSRVYRHGLAEFAYINQLPAVLSAELEARAIVAGAGPVQLETDESVVVPVGGGKDSVVTLELLKTSGFSVKAFSVGGATPSRDAARVTKVELWSAQRTLDPLLLMLNDAGAYNGHIPVTAINSLLALFATVLLGSRAVIMSNEWSASAATTQWKGVDVNHQWSKGLTFEEELANLVQQMISPDLAYLSLLRPLSEFAVARIFSHLPEHFSTFMSCNRYYRMAAGQSSWCCECDKCRFVFLILAPWLSRSQMLRIFGTNMLEDMGNIAGYRKLAGLDGDRPFDCVGEVDEVLAAWNALSQSPEWREAPVIAQLAKEILALPGADTAQARALAYHDVDMPFQYEKVIRAAL